MKQGWELKTLKDVGAIFSGNSINAKIKEEKYSGLSDGLPYVATKDIGYDSIINYKNGIKIPYDESGSFRIAPKNSVLICAEGGSAGRKIGRLAQDVCFVNKLFAITPDNEITSKYLYYWYKSNAFKEEFNSRLTGLIGGVSKRKFETIPIPIPPLEEQKQIVAKLDQCFEAIDKAKANAAKNLENAKELFQSKLNDIFSQKGEGWVEKKLGDVLNIERGGSPRPIKKYLTDDPDGLNWIKIGDATASDKYIYKTKQKITKDGLHKTRLVEEGDFILSNSMSFGKPYIMKTTGCIHDGWLTLKEKDGFNIDQDFLYHLLCSPNLFKQFDGLAAGSTVRNLNIALVSSVTVYIPPIDLQKTIASSLEKIKKQTQSLESKYQQELNSLEDLKKSILQKAFEGEL